LKSKGDCEEQTIPPEIIKPSVSNHFIE